VSVSTVNGLEMTISAVLDDCATQGENERIRNLGSADQKSELRVVEEELTRVCELESCMG